MNKKNFKNAEQFSYNILYKFLFSYRRFDCIQDVYAWFSVVRLLCTGCIGIKKNCCDNFTAYWGAFYVKELWHYSTVWSLYMVKNVIARFCRTTKLLIGYDPGAFHEECDRRKKFSLTTQVLPGYDPGAFHEEYYHRKKFSLTTQVLMGHDPSTPTAISRCSA